MGAQPRQAVGHRAEQLPQPDRAPRLRDVAQKELAFLLWEQETQYETYDGRATDGHGIWRSGRRPVTS